MNDMYVYICGAGIISPLGSGLAITEKALRENRSAVKPLELFPLQQGAPLPVGEVTSPKATSSLPRTHQLAHIAARQAMDGHRNPPDAVILGTTTGGILTTEQLLKSKEQNKELYQYHGLNTVADYIAQKVNCTGPAIVVSTACSSGAVAITLAMKMLRSGQAKTVLTGGVDSLCRLTYFGFNSLQLVDSKGCKPLDVNRQGMAVAEGAGMLLLSTVKPETFHAALLGAGLSCDAYHPAAPHPEGQGAFKAMQNALADTGLTPGDIEYINLHGTGTLDNDLAESKAIHRVFSTLPPLSSIKGATGHSLAAAGAIEAVISSITVSHQLMPANTGLQKADPALGVSPLTAPLERPTKAVLSNSFGFGGNNGSLVIGRPHSTLRDTQQPLATGLAIHGYSCLTGAGDTVETIQKIHDGAGIAGITEFETFSKNLPTRLIRRLKRLARMTLSLAKDAHDDSGCDNPHSIFMGTGWGALSETHDFLNRLTETREQFASPTDFVGSVHNGPASQVAIMFGAKGANITTSGGDYSFEQALLAADLILDDPTEPALVLGADEGHTLFSPLLDPSITPDSSLSDGGGALYVKRETKGAKCCISIPFYQNSTADRVMTELIAALTDTSGYALVMAGIPAAMINQGQKQLDQFMDLVKISVPVVHYRRFTGEFASASAVAATLAASILETGKIPGAFAEENEIQISSRKNKILILGLGKFISAMVLSKP